jgi:hypothetical protein
MSSYIAFRTLRDLLLQGRAGLAWVIGGRGEAGVDYQPTRDKTVDGYSLYSYKLDAPPVRLSDYKKPQLTFFTPHIFGQVQKMEIVVSTSAAFLLFSTLIPSLNSNSMTFRPGRFFCGVQSDWKSTFWMGLMHRSRL